MKTDQKFCKIYLWNGDVQNVEIVGHGNLRMEDLSVADVDIGLLLRVSGILSGFLKVLKGNSWNILFWVFLFIGLGLELKYLMKL